MKFIKPILDFLSSVRLSICLIIILGIAFAAGTFIESSYGTAAAQVLCYRTPWMSLLLLLLSLNLLISALERIPWKIKHIGFLTTHLGIILMLFGALVTQAFGIEGQLQIREGESSGRMSLPIEVLQMMSTSSEKTWSFWLEPNVFPYDGWKELKFSKDAPLRAFLKKQYPKAKRVEQIVEAKDGSPAIHVHLTGSMASAEEWLILQDPERAVLQLGASVIRFSDEPMKKETKKKEVEEKGMGTLHFDFEGGKSIKILVDEKMIDKPVALDQTPYQVTIKQIFRDAVVEQNKLVDRSLEWRNPALQLELGGNGTQEFHTVFSKFPDFPTVHGRAPSKAGVKISYETAEFKETSAKNELRFIPQSSGLPKYQIKKGDDLTEGTVEIGKEIPTGWMDFTFTVHSYLEKSEIKQTYEPLPNNSAASQAIPAIQLEVSNGSESRTLWLPQEQLTHFELDGKHYHAVYSLESKPLGFQLQLKDFMIDTDPGTDRPAAFRSSVILKDAAKGIEREHLIQMNEPLKHRGYKVYQSAYHLESGQPDISIFSVAKDPGNPLKYLGATILVGGILMLFYVKPFSTLKGSDPKLRTK